MAYSMIFVAIAALFLLVEGGSNTNQTVTCIQNKLKNDVPGYTEEFNKLRSLPIPRTKQALQEVMKKNDVVITATNGQMTVNKNKFEQFAATLQNKPSGNAMNTCKNSNDAEHMYREAARTVQCVFNQLKNTC